MKIVNDNTCAWINDVNKKTDIKILNKDKSCDWLIIGAGYTGLSAARKLAQLHPNENKKERYIKIGAKYLVPPNQLCTAVK